MKRVFYIYNPYSGAQINGKKLDYVVGRFLENGIFVQVHRLFTMQPDEALEAFFETAQEHFDAVVVSGGDGTLSQVLNVAMRHHCYLPMGFLPTGTCNDMVRSVGLPKSWQENLDLIIESVKQGTYHAVDIGLITPEEGEKIYFLNSVAAGVFVDLSHKTKPELKKMFGAMAYYGAALGELAELKPFRLRVVCGDRVFDEPVLLFILLNGTDVAGLKKVIPEANMSDGNLDILIVKDGTALESFQAGLKLIHAVKKAKTIELLRGESATIFADPAPIVSVDGEKGPALPYEIEVLPCALKLLGSEQTQAQLRSAPRKALPPHTESKP